MEVYTRKQVKIQLWHNCRFSVAGIDFQLQISRRSPEKQTTAIVDMESEHAFGFESAEEHEHQQTITLPEQTPNGTAAMNMVIDETPVHCNTDLFGVVAREAYSLSQWSQQEPVDPMRASVLGSIRSAAGGSENPRMVSPTFSTMPRNSAASTNLDTSEAIDSQRSKGQFVDTLLMSVGPDCTSKPPDELAAAEDGVPGGGVDIDDALLNMKPPFPAKDSPLKPTTTAATGDIDDTKDAWTSSGPLPKSKRRRHILDGELPRAKYTKHLGGRKRKTRNSLDEQPAADSEAQLDTEEVPSSPHVESLLTAQVGDATGEVITTAASSNIEEAEGVQNDLKPSIKAKRRKKGNTSQDSLLTHPKIVKLSSVRKSKSKTILSGSGFHNSQESMESTIEVRIGPPGRDHTGDKAPKPSLGESYEDPPSGTSSRWKRSASNGASSSIGRANSHEIKVLFVSTTEVHNVEAYKIPFTKAGVRKVVLLNDCDYLCVGTGELKKTAKVISAIATGKPIVFDEWAIQSASQGRLLDPTPFLASHPRHKKEWGITLADAIELGKQGLKPLADFLVLITPALKQHLGTAFEEVKHVAEVGGAAKVVVRPPTSRDQKSKTLVVATDDDPKLAQLAQEGWRCYTKDLITMSVLRSALDLQSDEFLIGKAPDVAENGRGCRSRTRKR